MRELTTALWMTHQSIPPRRETHEFIAAHFDALAGRVARDTPGFWPGYAAGLCSERDRMELLAFWRERVSRYAGGERHLAQAAEAIESCARLRAAQGSSVASVLPKR